MLKKSDLIVPLSKISSDDIELVGEKAANLGEMIKHGFPFPEGFVITQNAYHQFTLNHNLPDKLIRVIFRAYKRLEHSLKDAAVEIFISNLIKQKKESVIAKGEAVLIEKIKTIWARHSSAIVVRKIPLTSNHGIMFTVDPINSDKTKIVIYDEEKQNHYEVLKKNLKITFKAIHKGTKQKLKDKQIINIAALGKKLQAYCYFPQEVHFSIERNKIFITNIKPISHIISKFPLKEQQPSLIVKLVGINTLHRKPKLIHQFTQDSRFAESRRAKPQARINNTKILLKGNSIYPGIATGHLRIIQSMQDINKILRGDVVVIPYQDLVKNSVLKAGAFVATNKRLLRIPYLTPNSLFPGKPTVITTPESAKILTNGTVVTVNGTDGKVYTASQ